MAHIPDGLLSAPVLVTGAAVAAAMVAVGVRRLDAERIPQAAMLAAALFVASLVSVPAGPSSVHLLLNGLAGLLLGWAAAPAVLVALALQAAFFGYGGLLSLGVNTMNIAVPALVCAALLGRGLAAASPRGLVLRGAVAGALGVALTGTLVAVCIGASGPELVPAAQVLVVTYLPLAVGEAAVTAAAVGFLGRVAPELLAPESRR